MPQKPSSLKYASARHAHASTDELAKIGLHGALRTAILQCTMEAECAYVRVRTVLGEGKVGFRERVSLTFSHGSEVREMYDLAHRTTP